MADNKSSTLERAVDAARALPVEVQDVLGQELLERVEDFAVPPRSPERQEIIRRRLAKPLEATSRAEIERILEKYTPGV